MQLNEYQLDAYQFAAYKYTAYPFLGLAEEAGEVCGKFGKLVRGDKGDDMAEVALNEPSLLPEEAKNAIIKELGDVLWQVSACVTELGYSLEEVADINLAKLHDRRTAGVIKGEGDER